MTIKSRVETYSELQLSPACFRQWSRSGWEFHYSRKNYSFEPYLHSVGQSISYIKTPKPYAGWPKLLLTAASIDRNAGRVITSSSYFRIISTSS